MLRAMKSHTHFVALMGGAVLALVLGLPVIAAGLAALYFVLDLALDLVRRRARGRS
jgi:hypothetical protein